MENRREQLAGQLGELDADVQQMLIEDLPQQLASARNAIRNNDVSGAMAEVHAIHGTAAFCKLDALRHSAATLEQSLHDGRREDALFEEFECQLEMVLSLLANTPRVAKGEEK